MLNNNNPVQQNQIPINRIFCAFPIFCPSEKMYQRNLKSVISFVEYVKLNPHLLDGSKGFVLDIFYGGFSAKQIWFDTIKAYIKNNLEEMIDGNGKANNFVRVFQYDKNYGKSKIVNDLCWNYEQERNNTQFLFSMDSDILFLKDQTHFFDRLFLAAKCMEEIHLKQSGVKKSFGIISLQQKNACYHWFEPQSNGAKGMDQKIEYELNVQGSDIKMKEELVWPSDRMGVAGGAIFVNNLWWKSNGGYRKFNKEYCGDDGIAMSDAFNSNLTVCIIKTLSVEHPQPDTTDTEYIKWKEECMKSAFEPYDENKYQSSVNSEKSWIEK